VKAAISTPDGELRGPEGELQLYNAYSTAFPDFKITVEDIIAEGNKVVMRYTFAGTHQGTLPTIPAAASGKKVNVQGVAIFRVSKGRVEELRFIWDKFSLVQQIGVQPAAAAASA
jgi:steroid delta-isomerase-like uncharacterized protein